MRITALKRINDFLNRRINKFIVGPTLAALPAGVVNAYLAVDRLREPLQELIPHRLLIFIDENPISAFIIATVWLYLLPFTKGLLDDYVYKHTHITEERYIFLHKLLENIISAKEERFGGFVKSLSNQTLSQKKIDSRHAFNTITRPDRQIAFLTKGIQSFFKREHPEANIRVGMAAMKNNMPVEWLYWAPANQPPRTDVQQLQTEESTITTCARRAEMMIRQRGKTAKRTATSRPLPPTPNHRMNSQRLSCSGASGKPIMTG